VNERKDETPINEALREALVNAIVHADYSDRASVLIVKRPDLFGFRNPGLMRIPVEIALQGGEPDCRNRRLHQMFRYVGAGKQAGTGIPKILRGWGSQHWHPPKLYEQSTPYPQTILELRMLDLFPTEILNYLRTRFGHAFEALGQTERLALALATSEGTVTHARLREVSTEHPVNLSRSLRSLTDAGFLHSTGGPRSVYHLFGADLPTPDDVFGPLPNVGSSSLHVATSSLHSLAAPDNAREDRDATGCVVSAHLEAPIIDDLNLLSVEIRSRLESLATEPRNKAKLGRERLTQVIITLCRDHFVTLRSLAALVNRNPESLRDRYLTAMVKERKLVLAFPTTPNHERQAYRSAQD